MAPVGRQYVTRVHLGRRFYVPSVVIRYVTCHNVAYVSEDYPAEACVARVSLTLFSFLHILYDYIVIYTCMTCTNDYVSFSVTVV